MAVLAAAAAAAVFGGPAARASGELPFAPRNGRDAFLSNSSGAATYTYDPTYYDASNVAPVLNSLTIDAQPGASVTLVQSNYALQTVGSEYIGYANSGAFVMAGGTHVANTAAYPGVLTPFQPPSLPPLQAANPAAQPRSLDTTPSGVFVGYATGSTGTFTMAGGNFTYYGGLHVGYNGQGTFNQTDGQWYDWFSHAGVTIGEGATGVGTYAISGSAFLQTYGYLVVGDRGSGNFVQTGNSDVDVGEIFIAAEPGSVGVYDISSGGVGTIFRGGNARIIVGGQETASGLQAGGAGQLLISGTGGVYAEGGMYVCNTSAGTTTSGVFMSGGVLRTDYYAYFYGGGLTNNASFVQTGGYASLGVVSGTGTLSIGGGSGTAVTVASNFAQLSLTIKPNGTLQLLPNAHRYTNSAGSLTMTGGTLDLANHDLLTGAPPASVRQYLTDGYRGGLWNGSNAAIVSSVATAAFGGTAARSLGYATGGVDASAAPVPAGQTLVKFTVPGDADLSGAVDLADFNILQADYGKPGDWAQGDFNYDGLVDDADYQILKSNYGHQLAGPDLNIVAPPLSVPEPTGLAAGALALATMTLRRPRPKRHRDGNVPFNPKI